MDTYFLFTVQAFEIKTAEGQLVDFCTIKVVAETEKEALGKAETIVKKPHYRVSEVVEFIRNS